MIHQYIHTNITITSLSILLKCNESLFFTIFCRTKTHILEILKVIFSCRSYLFASAHARERARDEQDEKTTLVSHHEYHLPHAQIKTLTNK